VDGATERNFGYDSVLDEACTQVGHLHREREGALGGNAAAFKPPPMRPGEGIPVESCTASCCTFVSLTGLL
jgi:hypothetical protein